MCMVLQCCHVALKYARQQMLEVQLHMRPFALYLGQDLGASDQVLVLEPQEVHKFQRDLNVFTKESPSIACYTCVVLLEA